MSTIDFCKDCIYCRSEEDERFPVVKWFPNVFRALSSSRKVCAFPDFLDPVDGAMISCSALRGSIPRCSGYKQRKESGTVAKERTA